MKKLFFHRGFWIIAAIFWMLFIWSNSLRTATESSQQSQSVLDALTSLLSWNTWPSGFWHTLIRKLAHLTEFFLLGLLWSAALRPKQTPGSMWTGLGWVLIICLLTALVDETIQSFVPGRSGELRDIWIDFGGSLVGIATAVTIDKRLNHQMQMK